MLLVLTMQSNECDFFAREKMSVYSQKGRKQKKKKKEEQKGQRKIGGKYDLQRKNKIK